MAKSRVPNIRQLRYVGQILSKTESLLVRGLFAFFVVAIIFLGARLYTRNVVHSPRNGGEVVEGLLGNPQYVNPVLIGTNDVDRDLVRLMYAGLLRRDENQNIVPDLAESYDVSADGKTYTVHLRQNLTWSDGRPMSADDILVTYEFINDPLYKSPLRSQFKNVTITRIDDSTVTFTLSAPSASFLGKLTTGILPAHIWGDVQASNFALIEYNVRPVGSGPFKFDSLKRDSGSGFVKEYRLVRNPNYPGHRPYLDKLTFKFFEDPSSMAEAVRTKSIESVSVVTRDDRNELKQVRGVDLQLLQYSAVFFNTKRNSVKAPEVRKAFATAINRETIVREVTKNGATIVDGPLPSAVPGSVTSIQPSYNVDEANALLENSGWKRQDSGIRKKGNDELSLSLTVVDQPDEIAAGEIIKKAWEAIGAKVEMKSIDSTRIAKDVIKPRDYDAFLYGEILTSDIDLYPFWHSSQETDPGLNLTRFFNKGADTLLDELRTTTDQNLIIEKRIAFQRLLASNTDAIFLYSPFYTYGLSKRVHGFSTKYVTTPADRFNSVTDWYVNTTISLKKK